MPLLKTNGAEIYFESHGEGPPIVLAHGVGGNHASWYQQVPLFAESYNVVIFDHRGFGRSVQKDSRGRSAFVEDLLCLVDHLGLESVALVGQSMGGGTCLGFTCRHPQRVKALVLADSLLGFAEPEEVQPLMDAARARTENLSQVERVLGPIIRSRSPELALLYTQLAGFNTVNRHTLLGSFAPLHTPEDLAGTKVPVMFIVGLDDELFPPDAVKLVHKQTKGSFLVEVAEAGHSAYFERPIEFNDSVLSFLQAASYSGRRRPRHSNTPGYKAIN